MDGSVGHRRRLSRYTSKTYFIYVIYVERMAEPDDLPMAWIHSFLAVVDSGTFTAAAVAIHRSQPRVSAHVAGLERVLGSRLLSRGARQVSLTEAGFRFLPHARAAVAEIRSAIERIDPLAGDLHGSIAIGSFAGPSGVLLAPLIKGFRQQHPGVGIELREGGPRWLEDAAASFALDLSVRTADVPTRHNLSCQHLTNERIVLAMPSSSDFPTPEGSLLPRLTGQSLIVTGAPAEDWMDFTDRLSAAGIMPESVINVAHPTTVVALVRAGLGLGLLGEMGASISTFPDVSTMVLPEPLWTRSICAYWNGHRGLSMTAQSFLDALVEECRRHDVK